ncbi:MAG: ABC transporter permease [Halanaeroarchaeum sp.]
MIDQIVERLADPVVTKGLWQVGIATVLAVLVLVATYVRGFDVSLEKEFGVALVRGFVQIVAMGMVVGVLFTVDLAWSWIASCS